MRDPVPPPADVERVEAWCEARVRPELRAQMRVECTRRGRSLTIAERAPPWRPDPKGEEWTRTPVAQLRWSAELGAWELHSADRNGRWHRYEELAATRDVGRVLRELEDDPTSIFWG